MVSPASSAFHAQARWVDITMMFDHDDSIHHDSRLGGTFHEKAIQKYTVKVRVVPVDERKRRTLARSQPVSLV
jgi:hypothetical protein